MKNYMVAYRIGHGDNAPQYSALSYGVNINDALWNFYTASIGIDTHVISIIEA